MLGGSAAGISNVLLIRMYLLLTCEILAYIAIHVYISKDNKLSLFKLFLLCCCVIAGGLTHYYFYPFAFLFSALICLLLLYKRKHKDFFKYISALLIGFVINLFIFPTTIDHVFKGYRGKEVIDNLTGREENVFADYYLGCINNSIFGGLLKVFVGLIIIIILYRLYSKYISVNSQDCSNSLFKIKIKNKTNLEYNIKKSTLMYLLTSIAIIGFGFVAIVGSQLKYNRYIYPIYPIIALWIVSALCYIFKHKSVALCTVLAMNILSIKTNGIEYQYHDYTDAYEAAESIEGYDCLLYCDGWQELYTGFTLKFLYNETYFLGPDELNNVTEILNNRSTYDNVVVSLPDFTTDEDATNILNTIIENTPYESYEYIYHYYAQVYLLK